LEVGMDDFISKPVSIDRLAAMLRRWLSPNSSAAPAAVQTQTEDTGTMPVIDIGALTEILGSNEPEILNEVLAQFIGAAADSLSSAEAAVANGNPDLIKAAAHAAKGEARCAAAVGLAGLYAELERKAKDDDPAVSRELIARAAGELRRVENLIRERLGAKRS